MLTKPVILLIISVLVVAVIYGSFSTFYISTFYVFAREPATGFLEPPHVCWNNPEKLQATCCWGVNEDTVCQTCNVNTETGEFEDCSEQTIVEFGLPPTPTPSPLAPENALPQGDVQQLPPTTPPTGGEGLFGSEVLPTPPAGLAPPTEPPAPTSEPTVPPETGQGEEDGTGGGGGIKPPVKDLLPDTGITEQPDVQQPEQEQPSNEGQDTGGPLT